MGIFEKFISIYINVRICLRIWYESAPCQDHHIKCGFMETIF